MTILAKVQPTIGMSDLEADYTGILEPGPPSFQGLLAARTLAPVQAGLTYVRVMNPTTTDLHVPSETRLGDFHPLGNSEHDYSIVKADVATVMMTAEPFLQHTLPDV